MKSAVQQRQSLTQTKRPLPKQWKKVAGILRGRRAQLERHVRTVRNTWDGKHAS